MLPMILLALTAQAQIAEKDVPLILESVVTYVQSQDSIAGKQIAADQAKVFVDGAATARAFSSVIPTMSPVIPDAGRSYAATTQADVVKCELGAGCSVVDQGVFLTVKDVTPGSHQGEYLLHMNLKWNDPTSRGAGALHEGVKTVGVIETDGVWQVAYEYEMHY